MPSEPLYKWKMYIKRKCEPLPMHRSLHWTVNERTSSTKKPQQKKYLFKISPLFPQILCIDDMRNGTMHFWKMRTHTDLIQSMCKHHFFPIFLFTMYDKPNTRYQQNNTHRKNLLTFIFLSLARCMCQIVSLSTRLHGSDMQSKAEAMHG